MTLMLMPTEAAFCNRARAIGCTSGNKVAMTFSLGASTGEIASAGLRPLIRLPTILA